MLNFQLDKMENATIITLEPVSDPQSATFEEAFGEYSNLFGKKARARRSKRKASRREDRAKKRTARREARNANKAERIAMRDERKRLKTDTRQQRREDRKRNRQENRIARRADRKRARQDMRDEQQQRRQNRKRFRVEERMARKAMRQGPEEEDYLLEDGYDQGYDDGGYDDYEEVGYDDGGYDDGGYDDGGYDDGGYDDGGYDDGGYDDGGYEDPGTWGDSGQEYIYDSGDEWGGGGYDGPSWEDAPDEYVYEDSWGDGGNDQYGWFSGADGVKRKVSPKAMQLAKKIEWNKMLTNRLGGKALQAKAQGRNPKGILKMMRLRRNRINDLKSQGDAFCKDCPPAERRSRVGQLMIAKKLARKDRNDIERAQQTQQLGRAARSYALSKKGLMAPGGEETPVESDLNADISTQRIVVPAASRSSADGLGNGLGTGSWTMEDEDYMATPPPETVVNLGFDGSEDDGSEKGGKIKAMVKKINWKAVGVGVLVGGAVIFALHKSKMLKK